MAIAAAYMAPELCDALGSPSTNLAEYGPHIDKYSFGYAHVKSLNGFIIGYVFIVLCRIMMSEMVNMAPCTLAMNDSTRDPPCCGC